MGNAAAIAAAFKGGMPPGINGTNDRYTILLSNLNPDRVDEDKLFNLFSLYGNIVRIKILRNKPDHALVQMGDGFQAELAVHFLKLRKSKQYCGVCKKIWHHSDSGDRVCCDLCDVWVHAECAKISGKLFKDLEETDYCCPECKAMSNYEPSPSQKWQSKVRSVKNKGRAEVPDKIHIRCLH